MGSQQNKTQGQCTSDGAEQTVSAVRCSKMGKGGKVGQEVLGNVAKRRQSTTASGVEQEARGL